MKRRLAKTLALVLSVLLLLSACTGPAAPSASDSSGSKPAHTRERRTIPYSEMEYKRPDTAALMEEVDALTQQVKAAESFEDVLRLDEELSAKVEDFYTNYVLAFLHRYHDVTDTFYDEEMRILTDEMVELDQYTNRFNEALVTGPFAEDYRAEVGDYFFEGIERSLLFTSDEVKEFQKERSQLNQDYNRMISDNTVSVEGENYAIFDIMDGSLDELTYPLYLEYMNQYMEDYAAVYARMVELDKLTAETLGFKDAATMYYLTHNRDYTPADAKKLFTGVRQQLVPLVPGGYYDAGGVEYQQAMKSVSQALAKMDPELGECWDYMLEYELYDLPYDANKRQGASFSYYLYAYDAPFIFSNYAGGFDDANTIIHEFGHFYDYYLHYDDNMMDNLDIAETYSQGMEILMTQYHDLFTDQPEEAGKQVLRDLLEGALIWQSVLEDFQLRAYQLESLDGTSLGQLFAQVMEDYGYSTLYYANENGAVDDWLMYATIFDSPFYTVSYVTSAMAALQIWVQGESSWETAVNTYQAMIHADQNQPYTQLLEGAGLRSPFEQRVMGEVASLYRHTFTEEKPRRAA